MTIPTQPTLTAPVRWLVVSCAPGEVRKRNRSAFSSEQEMRNHAVQELAEGMLVGCFWEPLVLRPSRKKAAKAKAKRLRDAMVAEAQREFERLFPMAAFDEDPK